MRSNTTHTYYGPFKLADLRQIVEETKHVDGKETVHISVTPGDRPWESNQPYIEIG